MLTCEIEEPLRVNEGVHSLDEKTSEIVTSRCESDSLNRYRFFWLGAAEKKSKTFSSILFQVQQQLEEVATWVSAWKDNAAGINFNIRAKRIASEKRRSGWSLHQEGGLYVATKPLPIDQNTNIEVAEFDKPFEGSLIIFGHDVFPQLFTSKPLYPSIDVLASWRQLPPSEEFLSWLSENTMSAAYFLEDDRGYLTLTLVTPHRLEINDFQCQRTFSRI